MYYVEYSVFYPETQTHKLGRNYQVIATSEMNACARIGQMYNDSDVEKVVDICSVKRLFVVSDGE